MHAQTHYPPVVPECIIFSITHFMKDFDRKNFPSLTVAIKTTLHLRNKLPFLLSSRGYLSYIVWRAFRLLATRVFALRRGRHLSPVKHWVTSSHVVPTKRNQYLTPFSHDPTSVMLEFSSFPMQSLRFVSVYLHSCKPRQ